MIKYLESIVSRLKFKLLYRSFFNNMKIGAFFILLLFVFYVRGTLEKTIRVENTPI